MRGGERRGGGRGGGELPSAPVLKRIQEENLEDATSFI